MTGNWKRNWLELQPLQRGSELGRIKEILDMASGSKSQITKVMKPKPKPASDRADQGMEELQQDCVAQIVAASRRSGRAFPL
ncbi:hypothetical protein L3X38_004929 [Prunus dulcis]|uniref:Uncharacterized protein n=1 Tax=Prunus dulcis TaxID=3755 RepID=A0AAD5F3R3_PRUDU|nr:hypothetical protein L3X38_004929 [Prunus dulcis]